MKIALVSEHASPLAALGSVDAGGQNLHVAELSAALTDAGHRVTVYTRRDAERLPEAVTTSHGYDVVHVDAGPPRPVPKDELLPYMDEFARQLRLHWRSAPPDIVHSHFWMSGLAALSTTRTVPVPVVHTYHALGVVKRRHQGDDDTSPPQRIGVERWIGHRAARIVATCSDEVGELMHMGMPLSRIAVVPCGVDLERFTPDGPADPKRLPHRLVAVGRLVRRKGFDMAIEALPSLPDTELVIAGGPAQGELDDDAEARRLRELAERHTVADRVRLAGQVPQADMAALLRSADAVVCTPWYEPFGIVPLEAMGCAVPVVATAVGGLVDTVVHGVNGALVASKRPEDLVTAVRPYLDDPDLRTATGQAGRRRVDSHYSWKHVADQTLSAYRKAIADSRARDRSVMELMQSR